MYTMSTETAHKHVYKSSIYSQLCAITIEHTSICLVSMELSILVEISATVIEILTSNKCCLKVYRFQYRTPKFHRLLIVPVRLLRWPPNSHDLKTVDYAIWGKLQASTVTSTTSLSDSCRSGQDFKI